MTDPTIDPPLIFSMVGVTWVSGESASTDHWEGEDSKDQCDQHAQKEKDPQLEKAARPLPPLRELLIRNLCPFL